MRQGVDMRQPDESQNAEIFIEEHVGIMNQVDRLLATVEAQLDSLQDYPKTLDPATNEKLIEWKINIKETVNQFSDLLRGHVKREIAFMEVHFGEEIEKSDILKDEEVTEHLDELTWLLDNTPVRQIPVFMEYFKNKFEELREGVAEHCAQGDEILGSAEDLPETR